MATPMPDAGSHGVFSIREAAWVLGVSKNEVHRLIRVGELRAVWRRSRLVVPAHELTRLLPLPDEKGGAR